MLVLKDIDHRFLDGTASEAISVPTLYRPEVLNESSGLFHGIYGTNSSEQHRRKVIKKQ